MKNDFFCISPCSPDAYQSDYHLFGGEVTRPPTLFAYSLAYRQWLIAPFISSNQMFSRVIA